MGEILHLQYGNLSNFIMAHYWNMQDELIKCGLSDFVHSRLYTESAATGFYTPRTLIFDMKDMYGYYAPSDEREEVKSEDPRVQIYENTQLKKSLFSKFLDQKEEPEEHDPAEYEELPEELKEPVKPKEEEKKAKAPLTEEEELKGLQKLYAKFKFEETTQYWIDYSQTSFNPSNRVPVPLYQDVDDIADYQNGVVVAESNYQFRDDYEDKFRLMLEKADLISCLMVTHEWNNSFAGVATETLQGFKQEVPKRPIIAFAPVTPFVKKTTDPDEPWQLLNILMAVKDLAVPLADLTIPLNLPDLTPPDPKLLANVKMDLRYHLSALPACAIHSVVHQFCRKSQEIMDPRGWTTFFNCDSKAKIAHLRQSLPFVWFKGERLEDAVKKMDINTLSYFSPMTEKGKHPPYFSYNILRANSESKVAAVEECLDQVKGLSKYVKSIYFDENALLPISYPRYFSPFISSRGESLIVPQKDPQFVAQIPYYENIYLTYKTGGYFKKMLKTVTEKPLWLKKMISKGKLLADDWDEVRDELNHVVDCYGSLKGV